MRKILKACSFLVYILFVLNTLAVANSEETIIIDPNQNEKEVTPFKKKYRVPALHSKPVSRLNLTLKDLVWEYSEDGDYVDLIIRKKRWIGSVMLTNMYYGGKYIQEYGDKPYGLRAKKYNYINGNEVRIVNNKIIGKKQSLYFLVDSTPERHPFFGLAFRIRIPIVVEYGYRTIAENYGMITIDKGVTLNLRTYVRKYADHRGKYVNNPLLIDFSKRDYYELIRPDISKTKEYEDGGFKVVKIKYFSRASYIKYFLIRDIHEGKTFKRISFATKKTKKHKTAIVLQSIHRQGIGIHITALVYFKLGSAEKDYDISAVDQKNRIAKTFFSIVVPQKGKFKPINNNVDEIDNTEGNDSNLSSESIIFNENKSNEDNTFFIPD